MSGLTDLTFENEINDIYEEYLQHIATNSEPPSFDLPQSLNSSSTVRQIKYKGGPRKSFIWKHFSDDGDIRKCQVKINVSSQNPNGICEKKFPNVSSTSNCINHLLKCHNILTPDKTSKVNFFYKY